MARFEISESLQNGVYRQYETDFDPDEKFKASHNPRHSVNPRGKVVRPTKKELRSHQRRHPTLEQTAITERKSFEHASLRRFLVREDNVVLAAIVENALDKPGSRVRRRAEGMGVSILTPGISKRLYKLHFGYRPVEKALQFNHIVQSHCDAANELNPELFPELGEVVVLGADEENEEDTNRKRFLAILIKGTDADIVQFESIDLRAALGDQKSRILLSSVPHITVGTLLDREPAEPHIEALQNGLEVLKEQRGPIIRLGQACTTMHVNQY